MSLIPLLMLSTALAGPKLPGLEGVFAKPDPVAAVGAVQPLLVEVVRRRADGSVDRTTGLWMDPGAGLIVAPLDKVVFSDALAVRSAAGDVGAKLVAAEPRVGLAVLQVRQKGPGVGPRVVLRYPTVDEELPIAVRGGEGGMPVVTASTETRIGLAPGGWPTGSVLVEPRGGVIGMVVPGADDGEPPFVVPLVHAKPLLERARAEGTWLRSQGPREAQEACLALSRTGTTTARGCVDPRGLQSIAEGAALAAEAVLSAKAGQKEDINSSGWKEQLAGLLEGRFVPPPVDWLDTAEDASGPFVEPDAHELVYERTGMLVDAENPLRGMQELVGLGTRVVEVVQVDEESAWVRVSGHNLDGTAWSWSRHWVAFAGSWSLDVDLDADDLAGRPTHWPPALDEGTWLRDLLMARMIAAWEPPEPPPEEPESSGP